MAATQDEAMKHSEAERQARLRPSLALKVGFWACTVVAAAAVLRRLVALGHPSQINPQLATLDAAFSSHTSLTLAHILPAMAFVLLTPIVLLRRSDAVWPQRL